MKALFYSLAFVGIFLVLTPEEEARIKKLEGDIKSLQGQITILGKRVAALEAASPKPAVEPPSIAFGGKQRDAKWINSQYRRYRNRIVFMDGKYIKIDSLPREVRWVGKLKVGDYGRVKGEILQVLGPDEMLVSISGFSPISIHPDIGDAEMAEMRLRRQDKLQPDQPHSQVIFIKGISTKRLANHQEVKAEVWARETHEYLGTAGARQTVVKCISLSHLRLQLRRGIAKEEFIEALNQGLTLD